MECSFRFIAGFVALLALALSTVKASEDEFTLTLNQKKILDAFKERMMPSLPHDYMKQEIYLIRWLRDSQFDLEKAEMKLLQNLAWRERNQVDKIEFMDWSDFIVNYPYTTEVFDKEGRPTFAMSLGEWDIRAAAISGQTERLVLYWAKMMEDLMNKVRQLQKEGRNVTQCNFIIDVKAYSIQKHGCTQCLSVHTGLIRTMLEHYPGDVHRVHLVNAPRVFELFLDILRPFMGGNPNEILRTYGINRNEWRSKLYKEFAASQLPLEFGGTNFIAWD